MIKIVGAAFVALLALGLWLNGMIPFSTNQERKSAALSTIAPSPSRKEKRTTFLPKTKYIKKIPKNKKSVLLNDPKLHHKWGLDKISATQAWQLTTGSRDIIVAVVDTGIDVKHKDISANLWRNPGETGTDKKGRNKSTNGIDDDKNGYVDDVHGWNFVHNNHDLSDNHGHGTHIAGIVGAKGGNNFGVTGVAPNVSLMILKYFDPKAPGDNLANTIKSIAYAEKMNAQIINYSGGGLEYSRPEFNAIAKAQQRDILFVAAAGNERSNSDISQYYPADYDLDNVISVTAINPQLKVLASSNYGVHTVDIAAPGENIYSPLPGGRFGPMTGTSQATAFVSGTAALLMAKNRDFNSRTVKKHILQTGDVLPWLKSKTGTSKQLNMHRALTMFDKDIGLTGVVAGNTGATIEKSSRSPSNKEGIGGSLEEFANELLKKVDDK